MRLYLCDSEELEINSMKRIIIGSGNDSSKYCVINIENDIFSCNNCLAKSNIVNFTINGFYDIKNDIFNISGNIMPNSILKNFNNNVNYESIFDNKKTNFYHLYKNNRNDKYKLMINNTDFTNIQKVSTLDKISILLK